MIEQIKEIIKYKELLQNLTVKELKLRYKNSALGFFWSILNPLMMMVVYTFAFKYVLRITTENYAVVLLAGLLPWTFFQASISSATVSIVSNGNLVKKVYFPREIIPMSMIFSNFINFLITFIVLFGAVIISRIHIGLPILLLPVVLILLLAITVGLGLILSAYNVPYRDVSHFVEIIFLAWLYLTPVVYSLDLVPEAFRGIILLNPMALVVESIRACVIYSSVPDMKYLLGMLIYAVLLLAIGFRVFSKIEKGFAETI